MKQLAIYLDFIKENGISLVELNPEINEYALKINDALYALDLLTDAQVAILGGDVLTKDSNDKLNYIIHTIGFDYHFLNWYCDRLNNESQEEYVKRSNLVARNSIIETEKISKQLGIECYIVIDYEQEN